DPQPRECGAGQGLSIARRPAGPLREARIRLSGESPIDDDGPGKDNVARVRPIAENTATPEQQRERRLGLCHMLVRLVLRVAITLMASLPPAASRAAEGLPRAVLILDQNISDSVWFGPFSAAFRSTLHAAASGKPITIYTEHLDLNRFHGEDHDAVL